MHTEVGMGTATRLLVFVIATAVLVGSPVARAAEEVDMLLVLSSDVSRSVDARKFKLQRDGYAAAIVNPRVIQAIRSGALGKIAISFVEWSGIGQQKIVIDWTVIRDEATAKDFSAQIIEEPRAFRDRTSISGGIDFAMAQLARAPFQSNRHTIDVSDGERAIRCKPPRTDHDAVALAGQFFGELGQVSAKDCDRFLLVLGIKEPCEALTVAAGHRLQVS